MKNGQEKQKTLPTLDLESSTQTSAIILVHGTFATKAEWIKPESSFTTQLRAALPRSTIESFIWNGRNDHTARVEAGINLGKRVLELNSNRLQEVIIVAHSHGGNVALYALKNSEVRSRVTKIVFMGTPFLSILPINFEKSLSFYKGLTLAVAQLLTFFATILLLGAMVLLGPSFLGPDNYLVQSVSELFSASPLAALVIWLSAGSALLYVALFIVKTGCVWVLAHISTKIVVPNMRKARVLTRWLKQPEPNGQSLVVYTSKDEAMFALVTALHLSSTGWYLHSLLKKSFAPMFLFSLAVLVVFESEPHSIFMSASILETDRLFAFLKLYCFIALAAVLVFALPLVATIFGKLVEQLPFAFGGAKYDFSDLAASIEVSRLPFFATSKNSSLLRVRPSMRGLRHSSFYAEPAIAAKIANWLLGNLSSDPKPYQKPASLKEEASRELNLIGTLIGTGGGAYVSWPVYTHPPSTWGVVTIIIGILVPVAIWVIRKKNCARGN